MYNVNKVGLVMTTYYVYIISNAHNNILYTGVTYNIVNRIEEHKNRLHPKSFSAKYNVNKLVYYEELGDVNAAIAREKQIKAGSRAKKLALIQSINPNWEDLILRDFS